MDVRATLSTRQPPEAVFPWVEDLERYAEWNRLIHDVARLDDDADGPAWSVELRATVGPLARSKRLRMVRTVHRPPSAAVFERRELDGRRHAPWVLRVDVPAIAEGSEVRVELHYGGRLWTGGLLEKVLSDEIERGRSRLLSLLDEPRP